MNTYQWKTGARISGLAADVVAKHLESLDVSNGGISPEAVVRSAEPIASPIHRAFTWDNDEAANQYRLWQARHLIGSLEVRVETQLDEESVCVRAFLNTEVGTGGERVYYSLETVQQSDDLKSQVLAQVRRDISAARSKLRALQSVFEELTPLAEILDSAKELAEVIA